MAKLLHALIAFGTVAASTAASAQYENADTRWPHWYIGVQGALPFVNETGVAVNNATAGDLDFDTGAGVGVSLGYTPNFGNEVLNNTRYELEYFYRKNKLDQFSATGGGTFAVEDEISSDTYMVNAYYDFDLGGKLKPYLGAGLGMTEIELVAPSLAVEDEDSVFAYQVMAGFGYQPDFLLNTVLQFGYRYMDASDPEFANTLGQSVDHDYEVHAIEAGARFRF